MLNTKRSSLRWTKQLREANNCVQLRLLSNEIQFLTFFSTHFMRLFLVWCFQYHKTQIIYVEYKNHRMQITTEMEKPRNNYAVKFMTPNISNEEEKRQVVEMMKWKFFLGHNFNENDTQNQRGFSAVCAHKNIQEFVLNWREWKKDLLKFISWFRKIVVVARSDWVSFFVSFLCSKNKLCFQCVYGWLGTIACILIIH